MKALEGILVVSLEQAVAAPLCSLRLAEAGARVIKIEPPEGDDSRNFGPFIGKKSTYFSSLNRDKESIKLNTRIMMIASNLI